MLSLNIDTRDTKVSLKTLREKGIMPAVFYGKKQASTPVGILQADFIKVWKKAGESTIVTLVDKTGNKYDSLIQDVDFDPVTDVPRHVDFYVFEKGQKIEVEIPLEFEGVSPAVKDLGGIFVRVLHSLKIEAEPKDLPHDIRVDISSLVNFDSQILAKDIKLPSGVSLVEKPEEVVALVTEPKEEKEEVVAPVDLSAIEVAKKGKEAKEGEEGSEEAPAKEEKSDKK